MTSFSPADTLRIRPDGLVTLRVLCAKLGVARSTLWRWQKLELIAPALVEGNQTYWRTPAPHQVAEIERRVAEFRKEGQRRGGIASQSTGKMAEALEKARAAMVANPDCRKKAAKTLKDRAAESIPPGLISSKEFRSRYGLSEATLTRYKSQGWITPAYQCPKSQSNWWEPVAPEVIAQCRERGKEAQRERGRACCAKFQSSGKIDRMVKLAALRERTRPAGHLSCDESAARLGLTPTVIKGAVKDSRLPSVRVENWVWIDESELARWHSNRSLRGRPKSAPDERQVPYTPKTLTLSLPKPQPREEIKPPAKTTVVPPGGLPYEEALAAGKADPRFQGPLGFNLLRQGEFFRPVPVGVAPEFPWRWYQRHHRNGFGHWQMRTMNSTTGEVHL